MDLLKPILKATTLIEALVAMVVVMLSFGIAVTIFANVTESSPLNEKIRVEVLLQELLAKTKIEKNFLDGEMQSNGIKVQKKVAPYAAARGLSILCLTAFDRNNKIIVERKELIFSE